MKVTWARVRNATFFVPAALALTRPVGTRWEIRWARPLVAHPLVVAAVVVGVACDALMILAATAP